MRHGGTRAVVQEAEREQSQCNEEGLQELTSAQSSGP